MDSFIYALVLVPSLRDLLPLSGIAATKGNIGYYGGLLFAFFLIGWGLASTWSHRRQICADCAQKCQSPSNQKDANSNPP